MTIPDRYRVIRTRPTGGDPLGDNDRLIVDDVQGATVAIIYSDLLARVAAGALNKYNRNDPDSQQPFRPIAVTLMAAGPNILHVDATEPDLLRLAVEDTRSDSGLSFTLDPDLIKQLREIVAQYDDIT